MNNRPLIMACWIISLMSCSTHGEKAFIGQLKDVKVDLKDEIIRSSSDNSPQQLAEIMNQKVEKVDLPRTKNIDPLVTFNAPAESQSRSGDSSGKARHKQGSAEPNSIESEQAFERRATERDRIKSTAAAENVTLPGASGLDLQTAESSEIITLYKKFLEKYPSYKNRDQVMYQISRAYEELGNVEESMSIINKLVMDYPNSRYIDEFQFRRGEYYFTRKQYLDAEEAYQATVDLGSGSPYFELALYKLGWALYKQDMYAEALQRFISLLDYKASIGYDFEHAMDPLDQKRVEDIYRVISLAFSNLGGVEAVKEYFDKNGRRAYEASIYSNLGEYYLDKRRYSDAAASFKSYVKINPYDKISPHFDVRVNEIYKMGGFPKLVIDSHREFIADYGLKSDYWKHNDVDSFPEVQGYVKASLKQLANHYHALYQDGQLEKNREENFQEAMKWYRIYLDMFQKDGESPEINYQLANLLLENKMFEQAAIEYERTAYDYPAHKKTAAAAYATVYAYREYLSTAPPEEHERVLRDTIGSSWKFAETFPTHEKAAAVMGAAVADIYGMKEYNFTVAAGRKLLANFPNADPQVKSSVLLVIAHALFDMAQYEDAEETYKGSLRLRPEKDPIRDTVIENLAASIYKQGELANKLGNQKKAVEHFLRVAELAPTAKSRPAADYDAATALIELKEWEVATTVLWSFRRNYIGHALQPEVSKKLAAIYRETGKLALAAAEYERIETESQDVEVRQNAMQLAADYYNQAGQRADALRIYQRYTTYFPKPIEPAMEMRSKSAGILKEQKNSDSYLKELKQIVEIDAQAGAERTERTHYLAATAAMELAIPLYEKFSGIKLSQPFDQNLRKKSKAMKTAKEAFENLLGYEVGEVTSTATYYLAEMYYGFSRSLIDSERPDDLSDLEKDQYELSIEEQAYPFEERAIETHEKNLELISLGIYNSWIDKSIERLAKLVPAKYAKFEQSSGFIEAIDTANYAALVE